VALPSFVAHQTAHVIDKRLAVHLELVVNHFRQVVQFGLLIVFSAEKAVVDTSVPIVEVDIFFGVDVDEP